MTTPPTPTSIEQNTGITVYFTTTPGTGGTIRQVPEDFIVQELTNREEQETGKHLICTLTKKNWDTHHLVRDISRILHISQQRIGWAGTKDKQALTTQMITAFDCVLDMGFQGVHGLLCPAVQHRSDPALCCA